MLFFLFSFLFRLIDTHHPQFLERLTCLGLVNAVTAAHLAEFGLVDRSVTWRYGIDRIQVCETTVLYSFYILQGTKGKNRWEIFCIQRREARYIIRNFYEWMRDNEWKGYLLLDFLTFAFPFIFNPISLPIL